MWGDEIRVAPFVCFMEVTAQPDTLKRLSRYFQEQLQPQADVTPLQVQCALKDTLMVLIQHPPGDAPTPEAIFGGIERAIALPFHELEAFMESASTSTIKMYLRVLGQQKPYAFHQVEFVPPSLLELSKSWEAELAALLQELPAADLPPDPPDSGVEQEAVKVDRDGNGELEELAAGALVYVPPTERPSEPEPEKTIPRHLDVRSLLKLVLLGLGSFASLGLLGFGGYAITRPCVIGECQPLQTARSLAQQATQTIQPPATTAEVQRAIQQLVKTRQLLKEIPQWSSRYGEAQAFQIAIDYLLAAELKAGTAYQKGQATVQVTPDLQVTQSLWREAIAQLEAIPLESPLYGFVQARLNVYRSNLALMNQRAVKEQEAQKRFVTGRKTADLAITRQNAAKSLAEWQQVQATWLVAIKVLRQIPKEATHHAEAQQLLQSYQVKLNEVQNHIANEQLAARSYTQAINLEKYAVNLQQKQQWTQAIATWQNALNLVKQVPSGTSVYGKTQNKITAYTSFLNQAETMFKMRGDLDIICSSVGKICNYTIKNDAISIRFLPAYESRVRSLGGVSRSTGNYEVIHQIDTHLATLGSALQAVSTHSGLPIRAYNSDNQVIVTFMPGQ